MGPNPLVPAGSTAESASTANDQADQPPVGEPFQSISCYEMDSWSPTLEKTFADVTQSEMNIDTGIQDLIECIDQPEHHTNNNLAGTGFASSPTGASAGPQLPLSAAPSTQSDTIPTILPAHPSYVCSWIDQASNTQCNRVAPNKSAFLRHLGEIHKVSGAPDASILCQLLDSKTTSACNKPIKRGNYSRHADTHYPVRYQCQYCTTGKSFSRRDTWRNHIRIVHPQVPLAS